MFINFENFELLKTVETIMNILELYDNAQIYLYTINQNKKSYQRILQDLV